MSSEAPNANSKTPLDEFMLTEYSNLAQAFFNAGTGITQFFQYYLLAMGVPLTVAGIVVKVSGDTLDPVKVVQSAAAIALGIFFLLGGLVGVCMALYITNLRLDALLYARSVNGIRKYFHERRRGVEGDLQSFRLLPIEMNKPAYFEPGFFLPVVIAVSLLNATYLSLGLVLLGHGGVPRAAIAFGIAVVAQIALYWYLSHHRETQYPEARPSPSPAQKSSGPA